MVVYKIKRGLLANLAGATLNAYEPAFTTDTNELFIGDINGSPVKVTDHIQVTVLPAVEDAVKGKFYVVVTQDATTGIVHLFDGAKFVALSPDATTIASTLSSIQASLIAMQGDIDNKAKQVDLEATNTEVANVKVLAQKANDDLTTHLADADAKYAEKAYVDGKITDLVGGAPEALDTLIEISERLEADKTAADAIKTLAEANATKIATKAEQADLTTATDRITALENKPSVAGTNLIVGETTVAGDITFVATGTATIDIDEANKTISIDVPAIDIVDGGTF